MALADCGLFSNAHTGERRCDYCPGMRYNTSALAVLLTAPLT
jgi:hypothetical protein